KLWNGGGSRRALFPDFCTCDVPALSAQRVGLCGHDEVVPGEPADLVGPPRHRDTPLLGEQGGMVTFSLGEGAQPRWSHEAWCFPGQGEPCLGSGDAALSFAFAQATPTTSLTSAPPPSTAPLPAR